MTAKKDTKELTDMQAQMKLQADYIKNLEQTVGNQAVIIARLETNIAQLKRK